MFLAFTLILVAIALWIVIPPLRGKKPAYSSDLEQKNIEATRERLRDIEKDADNDLIASEQLESIREETETTLLMEIPNSEKVDVEEKSEFFHKAWTTIIVICIPVFAFLIYLSVGTPTAIVNNTAQQPQQQSQQLEQLVAQLEQRLAQNPDDEEGWLVLAQTNMVMQRFDKSVEAMENLYRLKGDTPDVLSRYADALTMANEGRFSEQASNLVNKALALDPEHTHSLWLAGMNAYQAEDYAAAIRFLSQARKNITDVENLAQLDQLIATARQRSGVEVQQQPTTDSNQVMLSVSVNIDATLLDDVSPSDTLFVFAKAAKGPPMPLAVSKHTASELPLSVKLDDSMAMMAELKLSSFDQVIISARVSKSDQPISQAGDLQGESTIINPNQINDISITIDQIVK